MVLAASGSKSAAGATMKSASQSNTKSTSSSNPRGPTGPSNSQPRSSPAGGTPGSVSRSSSFGSGADRRGGGGGGNSTTSRIGSAASAQRASPKTSAPNVGHGPGASIAAANASAALNAGLGRPTPGSLNVRQNISGVRSPGGAALGSFMTATEPAVRNYLSSPQGLADKAAGWSDMSRMAKARVMAREALNRPGVSYPNSMPAPQGVFGPRQAPRTGYLRDANALGMITTGMPSGLSGMPTRTQGTYAGYGTFNVPKTPQVLQASVGNTTVAPKNMTTSPIVRLPDGSLASSYQYQEVAKSPALSTYSGYGNFTVPERILGVETVPPRSNAGSFANYASQGLPPGYAETYFKQPSAPSTPNAVPSWQQSAYTGPTSVEPVLRDEPANFPVKPYGPATQKAIDGAIGPLPVIGAINTGLGLLGYSAGDIFTSEENKLANMTPEQRERYRAYWSDKRANAPGRGVENRGQPQFTPVNTPSGTLSDPAATQATASNAWEADAVAYGYSQAQLKDPEVRSLIKQLWDMGFIPKRATPTPT